jgi:arabinofuranosyltransferase
LENPLTHLILLAFAFVFLFWQSRPYYIGSLFFLASLMLVNRMDAILLLVPALLYALYTFRSWRTLRTALVSLFPFLVWEIFSLIYYGFLFPNTDYAKLNTGISSSALLKQGIYYLISSFQFDPLLFIVLLTGAILVLVKRSAHDLLLMLGAAFYIAHIVKVGGDFMAGRFLTAPFLVAVLVIVRNIHLGDKGTIVLLLTITVFLGFLTPNSRWYPFLRETYSTGGQAYVDTRGIADERLHYLNATGITNVSRSTPFPFHQNVQQALETRLAQEQHPERPVVVTWKAIGYYGFAVGPHVHVIDVYALGDPLLARLPCKHPWRIGHFERELPEGYSEMLQTGTISAIKAPGIARYYEKLQSVVSGPIFRWERFIEIWKFNTGAYDHWLREPGSVTLSRNPSPSLPSPFTTVFYPQVTERGGKQDERSQAG